MKKIFLCIIILSTIFFNGCFNYIDMDKVIFATAVAIDIDEQDSPIVYVEAYKASRGGKASSGKGQRVLFKGSAKTVFEALRDINLSSSYKINYSQIKGVIFTQRAAEKGLDTFIDVFTRGQEFVIRSEIVIFNGDPSSLMNIKLKEQDYIGLFIHDLIYNIRASSRGVVTSLNDFLNRNYEKGSCVAVTMVEIKKEQMEEKIEVGDASLIKNYKMIGKLKRDQGEAYNFLIDNIRGGTMEVTNPEYPDQFVTLEILKSKTENRIYYDGKRIHVRKLINTKASITEVQKGINLSQEALKGLEKNAEANIKKQCTRLFEQYKKRDIDIFGITEDFHRKYPRDNLNDIIGITELEIEPHVHIEGSTNITDFR